MIKRLLNLHTITKIALILTTLLLLPQTMLAEEKTYTTTVFAPQSTDIVSSWISNEEGYYYWEKSTSGSGTVDLGSYGNSSQWTIGANTALILKLNSVGKTPSNTTDFSITDCLKSASLSFNETTKEISGLTIEVGDYNSTNGQINSFGTLSFSDGEYKLVLSEMGKLNGKLVLKLTNTTNSTITIKYISSFSFTTETFIDYGISIGETQVSNLNNEDVLGDGQASFSPASGDTPATLTLKGIQLVGQISSSIQNLTVHLIGENSISSGSDNAPFNYTGGGDTTPTLTFESTEEEAGELIMSGALDIGGSGASTTLSMNYGYETITNKFDNGVGTGFLGDWAIIQEDGESYRIFRNAKYNLWVGDYQVSKANKTSIASGYPTYDDKTNTLELSEGYNIVVKSGMNNLTLGIRGASCSLSQVKFEPVSGGPSSGTLTIEKYNDETYPVNTLTINNENGAIVGFSNVMVNSPIKLAIPNSTPSTWDENIKEIVFSDEDIYNLKVAGNYVTSSNANNVLGMVQADKPTASFDAEKNTLTLQMASIGSDGLYVGSAIESGLDNLTVKFIGPSNINSNKAAFKALNESAKITFALDEEPGECYLGNGGIEGFAQKTFKNGLCYTHDDADQPRYYIKYLSPPSISYSDSQVIIHKVDSDYYSAASVYYTVAYHDGVDNVEETIYTGPFSMDKPGTVTTWLSTGEGNGVTKTVNAKLFEFAGPLKTTYDGTERILEESDIPKILPEVEGIEYSFEEPETNSVIGTTVVSDINKLTVRGLGKATVRAYIMPKESYDFEILNENGDGGIDLEAYILPSAPTFSINEGTYDETQSLVLTAPYKKQSADDPTTINVKYYINGDSSKPQEYSDQISINKSSSITAWVEAIVTPNTGGAPQTYESEKITKEYVIKEEPYLGFYKEVEENEFGEIGTDDVITSTYGSSTPKIKISDTSDLQGTLVFTSSNENVVASSSISTKFYEELEVTLLNYTIKGAGETTITATYTPAQNEPFLPKTISFKLKINPRDITDASLALGETSFTYTGTPIVPATTVSFAATETASAVTLTKDTDYSIACSDNTNVGTATLTVTGKGNYTGTLSATFSIAKATISPTVTLEGWTYGATANEPSVTGNTGNGEVTYAYKLQNAAEDAYAATKPTNAGAYTVKASIAATTNYEAATDSAHFTIAKAAGGLTYSAATASAELNGDGWTAPELQNPNNLTVTYTSSNTAVATISEAGAVTLAGTGETTIKAASAGGANHEACEAQYVLTVSRGKAKGYGIWIGETEADEDNSSDILGDGETGDDGEYTKAPSFVFNPDDNTLLVIGSDEGLTIESRIPELKIHLSQDNKLKKIFYNNQGNSENTGTLLFTCDSNFPGTATIGNTAGESAITGFASVSYEFNLTTLAPEKAKYLNGQMTDSLGVAADTVTVGTPLKPLQGDENETLNPDDFTVTNPDGSTATVDLTSANVNNILYTLPEGTDGQGYDPETNTICVVDPMTDEDVEKIAATTTNNTTTVGSSDYAENFVGLTFIIQGGEGVIKIDQEAEEGYEFHLKIGDDPSITLNSGKEEISYNLPDATYCWLYLVRKAAAARRIDGTRVGKRDRSPGSIRSVKVQPASVKASKSASEASGGMITQATNETITGIVEIKNETTDSRISIETTSNKWYTIDGRQINKPTQKGLYIRNKKKFVIK